MSDAGILDEPIHIEFKNSAKHVAIPEVIVPLHAKVEEAERSHIIKALDRCEGSVSKTAELLSISRKTLWEKMKRLEISA